MSLFSLIKAWRSLQRLEKGHAYIGYGQVLQKETLAGLQRETAALFALSGLEVCEYPYLAEKILRAPKIAATRMLAGFGMARELSDCATVKKIENLIRDLYKAGGASITSGSDLDQDIRSATASNHRASIALHRKYLEHPRASAGARETGEAIEAARDIYAHIRELPNSAQERWRIDERIRAVIPAEIWSPPSDLRFVPKYFGHAQSLDYN